MLASTFFVLLMTFVSYCTAGYVLEDDYSSGSFFSMFDFFTSGDPTHGYVSYVDQSTAQNGGLINTNNGAIYMGVDHTNTASGSGRSSVRLTSKKTYTHGLIILDLSHMPGGVCGTWPAFWTVGPGWPGSGEIDIIEGVNSQSANSMTLHTGSGCSISQNSGAFSGHMTTSNCDVNAAGQSANAGCQINAPGSSSSFGSGFNSQQGGVYATEWTSDAINIWFFPRGSLPSDISSSNPDPSGWGTPTAAFAGGSSCDIDSHFQNHQIVFDTTFCGDWASNVWSTDSVCSAKASTCQDYVQNNPSAFADAYWSVNSLKVYQANGASPSGGSSSSSVNVPPIPGSVLPTISVPSVISQPTSVPAVPTAATTWNTDAFSRGRGRPTEGGFTGFGGFGKAIATNTVDAEDAKTIQTSSSSSAVAPPSPTEMPTLNDTSSSAAFDTATINATSVSSAPASSTAAAQSTNSPLYQNTTTSSLDLNIEQPSPTSVSIASVSEASPSAETSNPPSSSTTDPMTVEATPDGNISEMPLSNSTSSSSPCPHHHDDHQHYPPPHQKRDLSGTPDPAEAEEEAQAEAEAEEEAEAELKAKKRQESHRHRHWRKSGAGHHWNRAGGASRRSYVVGNREEKGGLVSR